MASTSQAEKALRFRALHGPGKILVLPNAWDVPSARVFEELGFPAVATTSAGLMVSRGYPDGERIGRQELLSAIARIAGAISLPLSADIVAGFGKSIEDVMETVRGVVDAGAIGVNLEDFDHETKSLYPLERQTELVRKVRATAASTGIPLVVNARTDALRYFLGDPESKMNETIRRCKAFRDAGADCVYPMGLVDAGAISRFVAALEDFPINVMVRKGLPTVSELSRLGVRRVSFGPAAIYSLMGYLKRAAKEVLEHGTYGVLLDGAITFDELNRLAEPRRAAP
jgi:2-methylisocitrate lyase-like PEP mutase family enzyme